MFDPLFRFISLSLLYTQMSLAYILFIRLIECLYVVYSFLLIDILIGLSGYIVVVLTMMTLIRLDFRQVLPKVG
jgi:hypothetical protein